MVQVLRLYLMGWATEEELLHLLQRATRSQKTESVRTESFNFRALKAKLCPDFSNPRANSGLRFIRTSPPRRLSRKFNPSTKAADQNCVIPPIPANSTSASESTFLTQVP